MKVSIVVINYNDKLRIKRAIESAINQTWKEIEVIVVDDGSIQDVRNIYKDYSSKIELVQLERKDVAKRTPSRARNAGIKHATGEFICFLDSDNYYASTFVEELMKYNDKDVMFCDWEILGIENYKVNIGKVWDFERPILQNYLQHTHLDHQCLLIRRDYLDKAGYYDERLPRSQDCDMIVRLIMQEGTFQHVGKCLFHFEKHEQAQMKSYASIHGKTLWSLKNNINIQWLLPRLQDPLLIMSYIKAIDDFSSTQEWKTEYDNSEFKKLKEQHTNILSGERQEQICEDQAVMNAVK